LDRAATPEGQGGCGGGSGAALETAADEEVRTFLPELLADGPLGARKVFEEARRAGISEITLRRAKAREGVEVQKVGFHDGAKWLWS
jgi:hypothetical protein